ncbi:MAG: glutaminyl-peptide cyclotransferase [Brevefilum sp.]|nr:glutaminyl-peptide cyclotransferase [Brevefilum sp.]
MRIHHENRKGIWKKGWILLLLSILIAGAVLLIVFLDKKNFPNAIPESFTPTAVFTPTSAFTPSPAATPTEAFTPVMTYEVLNVFPHDPLAFTQGLIYLDGYLYESTGINNRSSLRKVDLETGEVLQQVDLSWEYFGEGLTDWEDMLVQLTWQENAGFVYDREDFTLVDQFTYSTEGWGLTNDGHQLIMSDGTSSLYFLNPGTWEVTGRVTVTYQGKNIARLNELEYIKGEIFANIYRTDDIIRIDPGSGEVLGWIDLGGILPQDLRGGTDVLNGIAYDQDGDRLFVTGKFWPQLYEIQLIPVPAE